MANKSAYLGEFEYVVLLAIHSLGSNAYGVTIKERMHQTIGREVSIGGLYITTERLQKKGLLRSYKSGATQMRGGKAKRFFQLTPQGIEQVRLTKRNFDAMWDTAAVRCDLLGAI